MVHVDLSSPNPKSTPNSWASCRPYRNPNSPSCPDDKPVRRGRHARALGRGLAAERQVDRRFQRARHVQDLRQEPGNRVGNDDAHLGEGAEVTVDAQVEAGTEKGRRDTATQEQVERRAAHVAQDLAGHVVDAFCRHAAGGGVAGGRVGRRGFAAVGRVGRGVDGRGAAAVVRGGGGGGAAQGSRLGGGQLLWASRRGGGLLLRLRRRRHRRGFARVGRHRDRGRRRLGRRRFGRLGGVVGEDGHGRAHGGVPGLHVGGRRRGGGGGVGEEGRERGRGRARGKRRVVGRDVTRRAVAWGRHARRGGQGLSITVGRGGGRGGGGGRLRPGPRALDGQGRPGFDHPVLRRQFEHRRGFIHLRHRLPLRGRTFRQVHLHRRLVVRGVGRRRRGGRPLHRRFRVTRRARASDGGQDVRVQAGQGVGVVAVRVGGRGGRGGGRGLGEQGAGGRGGRAGSGREEGGADKRAAHGCGGGGERKGGRPTRVCRGGARLQRARKYHRDPWCLFGVWWVVSEGQARRRRRCGEPWSKGPSAAGESAHGFFFWVRAQGATTAQQPTSRLKRGCGSTLSTAVWWQYPLVPCGESAGHSVVYAQRSACGSARVRGRRGEAAISRGEATSTPPGLASLGGDTRSSLLELHAGGEGHRCFACVAFSRRKKKTREWREWSGPPHQKRRDKKTPACAHTPATRSRATPAISSGRSLRLVALCAGRRASTAPSPRGLAEVCVHTTPPPSPPSMRPTAATSPPAEAGACSCSPAAAMAVVAAAAAPQSTWQVHVCRRRQALWTRLLSAASTAPLAALALLLLLASAPLAVTAARPGRPDASVEPASAALRSLLAAAPAPSQIPADVRDRLAKANAVLALRKAGLLPGNARLPASLQAKTVDAVNAAAPSYDIPGVGKARPVLTQQVGGGGDGARAQVAGAPAPSAPAKKWGPPPGWLASAPALAPRRGFDAGPAAATGPVRQPAGVNATGPLADLMAAAAAAAPASSPALAPHDKALDGRVQSNALIGELGGLGADQSTGSVIQMLGGFRVATPWFGTGFNFCVDRYFGSFPKVGIVIPNAAAWLLPDLASIFGDDPLHATVNLPSPGAGLPKDARAEPTSDGFVIWMPSTQPLYISNFGFRYSLQVAQLFGVDFGFGILKIGCRVDFVRV